MTWTLAIRKDGKAGLMVLHPDLYMRCFQSLRTVTGSKEQGQGVHAV